MAVSKYKGWYFPIKRTIWKRKISARAPVLECKKKARDSYAFCRDNKQKISSSQISLLIILFISSLFIRIFDGNT